jgi:predicted metal-dependent peptidase
MELSKEKVDQLRKRLWVSRTRILTKYGFLGLLLMHMKIGLDESIETAATDAEYILFNPTFLDELSESELDFIMMHEILHVVLKHCYRDGERDHELFNIACDIVVNSIILSEHNFNLDTITVNKYGTSMHLTPSGQEGCQFTAEEVYEMVLTQYKLTKKKSTGQDDDDSSDNSEDNGSSNGDNSSDEGNSNTIDDHSKWKDQGKDTKLEEAEWDNRIIDAAKAIERQENNRNCGSVPGYIKRLVKRITEPQVDWRYVLNEFIQEEINDYTFLPPDYRYDSGDFFLPSYSDTDEIVKDILFMIDTSGSMSDKAISMVYSEVYGAVSMFNGKLAGYLGFFDAIVYEPVEFSNINDLKTIIPYGGGGTSFDIIFNYVKKMENRPALIIILTDGYASFPSEDITDGIPVLWLVTSNVIPPFGKLAKIDINR